MVPETLLEKLSRCDTPTVCNAIEIAQGQRGFGNFTRRTMLRSIPGDRAIVGYARTAKISGANAPTCSPEEVRSRRLEYFRSMAGGPRPALAVVEDIDEPSCVAGWWGEIHVAVHKGLGLQGAVTNGVMRDLGTMNEDFPVIAGSVGPSHAWCHVREVGTPVTVFGMLVNEGSLVHADRHGAIVVPDDVIPTLSKAVDALRRSEATIIDAAKEPDFDIEQLEAAWTNFERSRSW